MERLYPRNGFADELWRQYFSMAMPPGELNIQGGNGFKRFQEIKIAVYAPGACPLKHIFNYIFSNLMLKIEFPGKKLFPHYTIKTTFERMRGGTRT